MAEEVARLVAVMEAELKGFTKGMEQAQEIADKRFGQIEQRMQKTEQTFSSGFRNLSDLANTFGVALSVGAVVEFGRRVFEVTAALQDQAKVAGITVERLQALRNVAMDNGTATDVMDRAISRINARLGEAADGSKQAQDGFKALGISAKDVAGKDAADVLALMARRTLELNDATRETAVLDTILGERIGRLLLPALHDLALGTDKLIAKYKEQGRILSEDLTKQAKLAADAMTKAGQQMEIAFAPALTTIGQMIAGLATLATQWTHTEAERQAFMARDTTNPNVGTTGIALHAAAMAAGIPFALPGTSKLSAAVGWADPDAASKAKQAAEAAKKIRDDILTHYADIAHKMSDQEFKDYTDFLEEKQKVIDEADQHEAEAAQETADKITEIWAEYYKNDAEQRQKVTDDLQKYYEELATKMSDTVYKKQVDAADQVRDAFNLTGAAAVRSFDNIGDAAKQLLQQLIAMIVQLEIMKPLTESLFGPSGSGFGGIIGSSLGSLLGFAGGGDPPVGRASIVGERGPELFVPRVAGTIVPNGSVGAPIRIELSVQPSGEFNARVAGISKRSAAEVVVAYDNALPRRVQQIADDPWRQ